MRLLGLLVVGHQSRVTQWGLLSIREYQNIPLFFRVSRMHFALHFACRSSVKRAKLFTHVQVMINLIESSTEVMPSLASFDENLRRYLMNIFTSWLFHLIGLAGNPWTI